VTSGSRENALQWALIEIKAAGLTFRDAGIDAAPAERPIGAAALRGVRRNYEAAAQGAAARSASGTDIFPMSAMRPRGDPRGGGRAIEDRLSVETAPPGMLRFLTADRSKDAGVTITTTVARAATDAGKSR
jgi:hypothetical protein